jgi:hypothetical protein
MSNSDSEPDELLPPPKLPLPKPSAKPKKAKRSTATPQSIGNPPAKRPIATDSELESDIEASPFPRKHKPAVAKVTKAEREKSIIETAGQERIKKLDLALRESTERQAREQREFEEREAKAKREFEEREAKAKRESEREKLNADKEKQQAARDEELMKAVKASLDTSARMSEMMMQFMAKNQ